MSTYQNGWTWLDGATEEQMENAANKAACDRLANEARDLYNEIPEIRRRGDEEPGEYSAEDAQAEDLADTLTSEYENELTPEQLEQVIEMGFEDLKRQASEKRAAQFGALGAIEDLLGARGARFCRPYEHHNEDEWLVEYMENRYDNEHEY